MNFLQTQHMKWLFILGIMASLFFAGVVHAASYNYIPNGETSSYYTSQPPMTDTCTDAYGTYHNGGSPIGIGGCYYPNGSDSWGDPPGTISPVSTYPAYGTSCAADAATLGISTTQTSYCADTTLNYVQPYVYIQWLGGPQSSGYAQVGINHFRTFSYSDPSNSNASQGVAYSCVNNPSQSDYCTVYVNTVAATLPAPTATLAANPSTITAGGTTSLTWSQTNATSCSIDNGVGAVTGSSGTVSVSPGATTTYTITCSNSQGSATAPATVTVTPAPQPTDTLTINGSTNVIVYNNTAVTLAWGAQNATSCSISPSVGTVSASGGSQQVTPPSNTTTTYTITCTGATGTTPATATAQVTTVQETSPTGLSAACSADGTSVTLSWAPTTGAVNYNVRLDDVSETKTSSCAFNWVCSSPPDYYNNYYTPTSVSYPTTPGDTYNWWVDSGSSSYTTVVNGLVCKAPPSPAPSCSITANNASSVTIAPGQSANIAWSSTNTKSCTATAPSSGFSTGNAVSGSASTGALSTSGTYPYDISCLGNDGSTCNATVANVIVSGPSATLTANPTRVAKGGTTALSWSSTNATSCSITRNGVAWTTPGTGSGSASLTGTNVTDTSPLTTQTTYKLTCTDAYSNSSNASVTVNVAPNFLNF